MRGAGYCSRWAPRKTVSQRGQDHPRPAQNRRDRRRRDRRPLRHLPFNSLPNHLQARRMTSRGSVTTLDFGLNLFGRYAENPVWRQELVFIYVFI
jgi:hypothetical protein